MTMNLSNIFDNLGENYTNTLNLTEICGKQDKLYGDVGIRLPLMLGITLAAIIVMGVSHKYVKTGRLEYKKWEKWIFEPCMVALIISQVFMFEVYVHGII